MSVQLIRPMNYLSIGLDGKPQITDGPFAETKEFLGGIMILEARDLNEAIQLMSRHPSVKMGGTFEIRPSADLSSLSEESKKRRAAAALV